MILPKMYSFAAPAENVQNSITCLSSSIRLVQMKKMYK